VHLERDQTNDTWLAATTSLGLLGVIARVKMTVYADFKVYANQTILDEADVLMVIFLLKYRHMLLQITGYVFPRDASCAVILTCIWRSGGPVGNIAIFPVLRTRSIPSDSVYIIRRQEKIPPQDVWRCSYISTWQRLPGMPFNSHTELRKQLK